MRRNPSIDGDNGGGRRVGGMSSAPRTPKERASPKEVSYKVRRVVLDNEGSGGSNAFVRRAGLPLRDSDILGTTRKLGIPVRLAHTCSRYITNPNNVELYYK